MNIAIYCVIAILITIVGALLGMALTLYAVRPIIIDYRRSLSKREIEILNYPKASEHKDADDDQAVVQYDQAEDYGRINMSKKTKEKTMEKSIDLKEVLRLHERWINGYEDGRHADLSQRDLSHSDLRGADLRNASLRNTDLRGADLHDVDLRGADLGSAYLRGADLHDVDLRGADLGSAYLRGADLRGADLHDADLYGADLHDVDLRGAYLRGADLRGADLGGADLSYATFDDHIFCLDRIGSIKRRTTYNATKDIVWCGCFTGTFEEWVMKIRNTYPDENNVYRKEYEAAIAYFKAVAKASGK